MNPSTSDGADRLSPSVCDDSQKMKQLIMPPPPSESISIQDRTVPRHSFSYPFSDEDQISLTAVNMYDNATWRMYHRIMNERKRRAKIAKRLGLQLENYPPSHNRNQPITSSPEHTRKIKSNKVSSKHVEPFLKQQKQEDDEYSITNEGIERRRSRSLSGDWGIFQMDL